MPRPVIVVPTLTCELPEAITQRFTCRTAHTLKADERVCALISEQPQPPQAFAQLEVTELNHTPRVLAFIVQALTYEHWQQLLADGLSRGLLTEFHARYKYLLMAHDPARYRSLGRLLGQLAQQPLPPPEYFAELMQALKQTPSVQNHCNTLQHIAGYLKPQLSGEQRRHLQSLIERYQQGLCGLDTPRGALLEHFAQHQHPYISQQIYLYPELAGQLLIKGASRLRR